MMRVITLKLKGYLYILSRMVRFIARGSSLKKKILISCSVLCHWLATGLREEGNLIVSGDTSCVSFASL